MNPPPNALGLILCEKVIVEERTRNLTLVSLFSGMVAEGFPSEHLRFAFATVLTGGRGDASLDLVITELETDEEIYAMRRTLHFPDRLTEVKAVFHIRDCSFPVAGYYEATLFIDGDWMARRKFYVREQE
jgi:hypothetical protein